MVYIWLLSYNNMVCSCILTYILPLFDFAHAVSSDVFNNLRLKYWGLLKFEAVQYELIDILKNAKTYYFRKLSFINTPSGTVSLVTSFFIFQPSITGACCDTLY